jgi:hypothetical protein
MRAARAALLALLGLAAGSPLRADVPDAHTLISRCARDADATLRGLDALRTRCPGIEQALYRLGLEQFLPAEWPKELSPRALADLDALASRYAGAPSGATAQLDVLRLQSIARSLEPPPSAISGWEWLQAWLRKWFESSGGNSPAWLRLLLRFHISVSVWRVIFLTLVASVLMVLGAIVVIELRAAGAGARSGRRSRSLRRRSTAGATSAPEGSSELAYLEMAAARDRPVLLLRALVQALTRAHRLRRDKELTCRELVAEAHFDTARQRRDFQDVALLAERALYGGAHAAPPAIPEQLLLSARVLHDQLLVAPPVAEGAGR